MKKGIIGIVIIVLLICGGLYCFNIASQIEELVFSYENVDEMKEVIENVYEKSKIDIMGVESNEIDKSDKDMLASFTGLASDKGVEKVVVSESMMTSTPYSMVLVKAEDGADVESIKKEMVNSIDMRKWICVSADVVYATNYYNLIFLVMADEETAKKQYDAFVELTEKNTGKMLERKAEVMDFWDESFGSDESDDIVIVQDDGSVPLDEDAEYDDGLTIQ